MADPSAPDAFVNGIMEGKEWVWDNGIVKEVEIARYRKEMQKKTRDRYEQKAQIFADFLSKL